MNLDNDRRRDFFIFLLMTLERDGRLIQQLIVKDIQIMRCDVLDRNVANGRFDIVSDVVLTAG